jgi:hypothetical protein
MQSLVADLGVALTSSPPNSPAADCPAPLGWLSSPVAHRASLGLLAMTVTRSLFLPSPGRWFTAACTVSEWLSAGSVSDLASDDRCYIGPFVRTRAGSDLFSAFAKLGSLLVGCQRGLPTPHSVSWLHFSSCAFRCFPGFALGHRIIPERAQWSLATPVLRWLRMPIGESLLNIWFRRCSAVVDSSSVSKFA